MHLSLTYQSVETYFQVVFFLTSASHSTGSKTSVIAKR